MVAPHCNAGGLQPLLDHAMQLAGSDSGLANANPLDFIQNLLLQQFTFQVVLHRFVKGLARAREKAAQVRHGIFQAVLRAREECAFDTVEPKVFFTSIW